MPRYRSGCRGRGRRACAPASPRMLGGGHLEHAHFLEHLGDPPGADVHGLLQRDDLRVPDGVARLVPGQHDDQRPADVEPQSPPPASCLAALPGQVESPGQPRVAEVGVRVFVEPGEVPPRLEQPGLHPAEAGRPAGACGGWPGPRRSTGGPGRGAAELHPVEEQLVPGQAPPSSRTDTAPRGRPPASRDW